MRQTLFSLLFFSAISPHLLFAEDAKPETPVAVAAPSSEVAKKQGEPRVVVREGIFHFGEVSQGEKVAHSFEIQNLGEAPLRIDRVNADCGCTTTKMSTQELAPGQSAQVSAVFNTEGFSGQKTKHVRVHTNDPKQPVTLLTFQGKVRLDVQLEPPRLYFGMVPKGASPTKSATVVIDKNSKIRIREIVSRSDDLKIQVKDISTATQIRKKIIATLKDTISTGVFRTRVVIKTTSKNNPVSNMQVFARVVGDLQLSPPDLSLGLLEGPLLKEISRNIKFVNKGKENIKILKIESDSPFVEASIVGTNSGGEQTLEVRVLQGAAGALRGRVKIITNHPDPEQRELFLPVYAIITRKGQ